jgi:site-specific recombinase XerD
MATIEGTAEVLSDDLVQPGTALAIVPPSAIVALPPAAPIQAETDEAMILLWLDGLSPRTRRAYEADIRAFNHLVNRPLRKITLRDLQAYKAALTVVDEATGKPALASATQARRLSSVKSLLTAAHELGYLALNIGSRVKLPPIKQTLAERILSDDDVREMLTLERDPRNKALLRLLYMGGLRISEACGLRVRDLQPSGDACQITVYGKGGKTRVVLLTPSIWKALAVLRGNDADAPLFRSRERKSTGPAINEYVMDPSQVHRIVKAAAKRAGLSNAVSAHWLRHAHVSHALDAGAPAHLVQATVGHASLATTSRYAHARPSDSSARYLRG